MKINFTKKTLDELNLPPTGKQLSIYDNKISGLAIRITPKGKKTFTVYKRIKGGRPVRVTLGSYPDMTIEQARRHAMNVMSQLSEGVNVNAERKALNHKDVTLKEVFQKYISTKNLKPATLENYSIVMNHYLSDWQSTPLSKITKNAVAEKFQAIAKNSPSQANKTFYVLRALFNYAKAVYEDGDGNPLFPHNPVSRLSDTHAWHKLKRRQTVIKAHELAKWYEAINELPCDTAYSRPATTRDYLLFILFTGLRRREASYLQWDNIDFDGRTFTILDTKNHQPHTLPLSDFLFELLEKRYHMKERDEKFVFPSRNPGQPLNDARKQINKVRQISGVFFTVHDLRRTFITIAESIDISFYTLKRLLNHKMQQDVTAGYIVTDVERLREPMEHISQHILKLCQMTHE